MLRANRLILAEVTMRTTRERVILLTIRAEVFMHLAEEIVSDGSVMAEWAFFPLVCNVLFAAV